jgi:hypothetical protein
MERVRRHGPTIDSQRIESGEDFAAKVVISHRTDHGRPRTQGPGVVGEIGRRPAELFPGRKEIPEDFAESGDDGFGRVHGGAFSPGRGGGCKKACLVENDTAREARIGYNALMLTKDEVFKRREEIIAVARRYGASDIRIFGSVARGDAIETSDLDLLVRLEPGRSLFDQGGLLMDLRELLGIKVDVIDEGALSGRFEREVRREAIPL